MNAQQWNRFWSLVAVGTENECWPWQGPTRTRPNGFVYGYFQNAGKKTGAHRLAYWSRYKHPDNQLVCHRCDNPLCCNPAHLFVGSHQDNMDDAKRKGRTARGTKINTCKLTETDVREIRRSSASVRSLAAQYNVSFSAISQIKRRETWKWVT